MSPTPVDRSERDALIVALLEECPYTTQELERRVGRGMNMALPALARKGIVKACADHRWALPDFDEATLASYPRVDPVLTATRVGDGKALRHAHERPAHITLKHERPSWWAVANRDGFTALASSEAIRMRGSKECHQVRADRMLQ